MAGRKKERYHFPAIFHPNDDGSVTVTFPDIPGCITEGKTEEEAFEMAQEALTDMLDYYESSNRDIPNPSKMQDINTVNDEYVSMIYTIEKTKAVRRTVSLPQWMDEAAQKQGISLSKILQDALIEALK